MAALKELTFIDTNFTVSSLYFFSAVLIQHSQKLGKTWYFLLQITLSVNFKSLFCFLDTVSPSWANNLN